MTGSHCKSTGGLPRGAADLRSHHPRYYDRVRPARLQLDPEMVQNIAILNYADVLRRFMANQSAGLADLDYGVQECVKARSVCRQPV